jgi:hypothetical protein
MIVKPDDHAIGRVEEWALEGIIDDEKYYYMSAGDENAYSDGYSQGVRNTLAWLKGETCKSPDGIYGYCAEK